MINPLKMICLKKEIWGKVIEIVNNVYVLKNFNVTEERN